MGRYRCATNVMPPEEQSVRLTPIASEVYRPCGKVAAADVDPHGRTFQACAEHAAEAESAGWDVEWWEEAS